MTRVNQLSEVSQVFQKTSSAITTSEASGDIDMTQGPKANKKVTDKDIEQALNQPNAHKAINLLLSKSPVGLGHQSSANELGVLGYADTGMRNFHMGAPITYASSDGGTVTVYDDMRMGKTDAGPRTTIYRTDRYEQTIIYNENGEAVKGTIKIRDKVAGFVEESFTFEIVDGKLGHIIR